MSECRGQGYDNMTSRSPGKYLRNNSEALNDPYGSQNLDLLLGGVTMVEAINLFWSFTICNQFSASPSRRDILQTCDPHTHNKNELSKEELAHAHRVIKYAHKT